jgi:hypothetical protein
MPTGYTAELMEKGLPFRTFVLQCARAFGACIEQRDEAISVLPRKTERGSYHLDGEREARKEFQRLKAMPNRMRIAMGKKMRAEAIRNAKRSLAKSTKEDARLDAMAAKVLAWNPPTEEHQGLKDFMLEQIKISRHDLSWSQKWLKEAEEKKPVDYFAERVAGAERDIAYHREELAKEQNRTELRNGWIEDLYKSLPPR